MERVTIPDYLLIAERGEGNLSLIFLEAKYVSCPQAPQMILIDGYRVCYKSILFQCRRARSSLAA
jgi:hypothetical protein